MRYNNTVLIIKHTKNNIILDEIIVLKKDGIYGVNYLNIIIYGIIYFI